MRLDDGQIEVMDEAMVPVLRSLTGSQRVQSMFDMMEFGRDTVLAAVRQKHPDWTQEQVNREAMRRLFTHGDHR
ncbi:hypothetical protein HED60_19805 [Planctomycetales bacterium ZRK34]|nr:hypothetical protein HED60_19805 [Planctomycetales bacterium ZRK34]